MARSARATDSRAWAAYPPSSCPSRTGVASCRCVRPILTTPSSSVALAGSTSCRCFRAGISEALISTAARDVQGRGDHVVGALLHVDVVVGVDRVLARRGWPVAISLARLAITSLAFMLVDGAAAGLEHVDDERARPASRRPPPGPPAGSGPAWPRRAASARSSPGPRPTSPARRRRRTAAAAPARDREVLHRPGRAGPVVGVGRHLHVAHGVVVRFGCSSGSCSGSGCRAEWYTAASPDGEADARKPSPFPGMDPHLERSWEDVHPTLITYTGDALPAAARRPVGPDGGAGLQSTPGTRRPPNRSCGPDVLIVEDPSPGPTVHRAGAGTAVASDRLGPCLAR